MKVILQEDVSPLGKAGEIKEVSAGYARNYLFPRKIALIASAENLRRWETKKRFLSKQAELQRQTVREMVERLKTVSLTVQVKVGTGSKLFGSVTSEDIVQCLRAQGFPVDKKQVLLEHPIKELGAYFVKLRLSSEVEGEVKLWVVAEGETQSGDKTNG